MDSDQEDPHSPLAQSFEPGWYERETIMRAREGDRDAALEAIDLAIAGLHAGALNSVVAAYLAEALQETHTALKGEPDRAPGDVLAHAFKVARPAKRPIEARTRDRAIDVAVWVHLAVSECGLKLPEAKTRASEIFGLENVNRTLRHIGPVESCNAAHFRKLFAEQGRPLPPRQ